VTARLLALVALAAAAPGEPQAHRSGRLVVEVSGFRSDQGQLLLRIYDREDGFPTDGGKALRQVKQRIQSGRAAVDLASLPFGSYAIGCVHDENGNGKLDTNLLGIPREGVGASNDARGRRGPPSWRDARFDFRSDGTTIRIHLIY
jgi:uncharacterized protein (DUF2141 family)